MAQPAGQVLVDTGHALAGTLFCYANSNGVWDASSGAMLAKTGTGSVSVEGGANVINSAGTTYFDLSSVITTSGAFSFGFRARTTANNNASMVGGDRTNTASYVWLNNGSNALLLKATSNSNQVTVGATTTMATYWIVRDAGNVVSFYKNGVLVTPTRVIAGTFVLRNLMSGYSGGSFSLNGAAEFWHYIPSAISVGDVASLSADPYQVLLGAPSGVTVDASGAGAMSWAASGSVSVDVMPVSPGSITINSPKPYQARQRNKATGLTRIPFTVSLAYTGAPTGFEYRFAGGEWTALPGVPSGGNYSTSLHLPVGQGAFEVRFANDTGVSASSAAVTVGPVWAPAGQSNAGGRSPGVVAPVAGASGLSVKLGRDGIWKPLTEAATVSGSFDEGASAAGSVWGAVTNRLQAQGVPLAFIPCAQGSTSLSDWARYDPDPSNPYFLYGDVWQAWLAAGGLEGVLFWQGENEAAAGVSQAAYSAPINTLVNNIWTDFGCGTFIVKIVNWVAGAAAIRAAQDDVIATNPHVVGWADGNQYAGDVHYRTVGEINALADVIAPAMVGAFYTDPVSAAVAGTGAMSWAASGAIAADLGPAPVSAAVAGLGAMQWAASGAVSVDLFDLQPDTITASAAGFGGMAWAAAGAIAASILPPVAVDVQGAATMAWAAVGSVYTSDGSIVWPTNPAGPTHRAVVPFHGVRFIVPAGAPKMPITPLQKQPADIEVYEIDWAERYLEGAGDTPGNLLAITADAGIIVTPEVPIGSPVKGGVLRVRVSGGTSGNSYKVTARMSTAGGREKEADIEVKVMEV